MTTQTAARTTPPKAPPTGRAPRPAATRQSTPPRRKVAFAQPEPQGHRVCLYGGGGTGKTTLACNAPGPVAIFDLETSLPVLRPQLPEELDLRIVAGVETWQDLRGALHADGWQDVGTIVIDSVTRAEELCAAWVLANVPLDNGRRAERLEDYGWGKQFGHIYDTFLALLGDLDRLTSNQDRVGFAYAHKPFCVITKAVDLIIEPSMYQHGVNLYHRGGNISLSNMIYFITRSLAGEAYLWELLEALQRFVRQPSPTTYAVLERALESKTGLRRGKAHSRQPLREVLGFLHLPLLAMDVRDLGRLSSEDLEICFTFALCLMGSWARRLGQDMLLIHDANSEMSKQRGLWEKIVSPHVPPAKVGWDRRTMEFPIRVRETRFESSRDWAGLQLADVLAGALAEPLRPLNQPDGLRCDYVNKLCAVLGEWSCEEHIWPEAKFTPDELETDGGFVSDPVQHMMDLVSRREETEQGD